MCTGELPGGHGMDRYAIVQASRHTISLTAFFAVAHMWWILSCSARTWHECERIGAWIIIMYTKKGIKARGLSGSMAE
jgi:hypothetical protein